MITTPGMAIGPHDREPIVVWRKASGSHVNGQCVQVAVIDGGQED